MLYGFTLNGVANQATGSRHFVMPHNDEILIRCIKNEFM
jgi:hypothetical protein